MASRRKCEEIIQAGRVKVNRKVVKIPQTRVNTRKDRVEVDGRVIQATQRKLYFLVNKPKGYICSEVSQPDLAAKPVVSLLEPFLTSWLSGKPVGATPPRLFTVGRLDVNTTGMILVTNDGKWAHRVAHPSAGASPRVWTPHGGEELADAATAYLVHGCRYAMMSPWYLRAWHPGCRTARHSRGLSLIHI